MATTYEEVYFKDAAFYHPTGGGPLAGRTTSRALVVNDVIKLHKVERDTKIGDVCLSNPSLDSDGTPAIVIELQLTDGTTTVVLATATAAVGGAGGITRLTNPAALGYVVPSRGFWLQIKCTTGPDVGVAGVIGFSVQRTNVLSGAESPLVPTG